MMRSISIFIFALFWNLVSAGASDIDHWETVIFEGDVWKYFVGTTAPEDSWKELGFDDGSWQEGQGGIGFGDGDDLTIIPQTGALYIRKEFAIVDLSNIERLLLHMDYDDGFVAYINGVEIARYNLEEDEPSYTDLANYSHEAVMYNGQIPEEYLISTSTLDDLLLEGNNVLSIQIHNQFLTSSDLTARAFLSVAINNASFDYSQTPAWFVAPVDFESSNLPIVSINTFGHAIHDDNRIVADMGIVSNGPGQSNSVDDPMNEYNGRISLEYRGSGSILFPKKSYSLETQTMNGENNNVAIMGMPEENDWILYGPYSDHTLLRNDLVFHLGRELGTYAPRTTFCELLLNGQYQGIYVFMEKIKRDENRVDVTENIEPEIDGGYILKIDKLTSSSEYDWSSPIPPLGESGQTINYQIHYPKPDDISEAQKEYIQGYVTEFEELLASSVFDQSLDGYRDYIDVESFIDFFIINELTKNVDAYRISTYFYKDGEEGGGRLHMGPLWDFNLGFGGIGHCQAASIESWAYQFNMICPEHDHQVPFWWSRFLEDDSFVSELHCRWNDLRSSTLHKDSIFDYVDSQYNELEEAQLRNATRWPKYENDYSYNEEIDQLKEWIGSRIDWLDANIPGNCMSFDFENEFFRLFPNPVEATLEIRFSDEINGERNIEILDSSGRVVELFQSLNTVLEIDLSFLRQGIYLIKVESGGEQGIQKVVKI